MRRNPWLEASATTVKFRKKLWRLFTPWRISTNICLAGGLSFWRTTNPCLRFLDRKRPANSFLAANGLVRWALFLNQFSYQVVYRKTSDQNADVLSRLPDGVDTVFDAEEDAEDVDTVCMVTSLRFQVRPSDPASLVTKTAKDPVLTKVMRFAL